jgi:hypothetical protein
VVKIASAIAEIGAPGWLPVLRFWARSLGVSAAGACGATSTLGEAVIGVVSVVVADPAAVGVAEENGGAVATSVVPMPKLVAGGVL